MAPPRIIATIRRAPLLLLLALAACSSPLPGPPGDGGAGDAQDAPEARGPRTCLTLDPAGNALLCEEGAIFCVEGALPDVACPEGGRYGCEREGRRVWAYGSPIDCGALGMQAIP